MESCTNLLPVLLHLKSSVILCLRHTTFGDKFPSRFHTDFKTEHRDWLSYLGHQNTTAIYHDKCHRRFLWSFLRIHGYLPREIYLGKVRSHSLNAVVKRSIPTLNVFRVTAPDESIAFFLRYPCCRRRRCFSFPQHVYLGRVQTLFRQTSLELHT